MKLLGLALVFLAQAAIVSSIQINEIMYDPGGSDSGREWIELYNNQSFDQNIDDWTFFENNVNHGLNLINGSFLMPKDSYLIIADDFEMFLLDYPDFNGTLIDSSWGSLSNSGENLAIKDDSGNVVNEVNYTNFLFGGDGLSIERFHYGWNSSARSGGTPGFANNDSISDADSGVDDKGQEKIESKGISISVNLEDVIFKGVEYTSLFQIENLDHVSGVTSNIDVILQYNITSGNETITAEEVSIEGLNKRKTANTGSFKPNSSGFYTITGTIVSATTNDTNIADNSATKSLEVVDTSNIECDVILNITHDEFIYNESDSIKFKNNLNNETYPYIIQYNIEDLFGNIYKKPVNTSNTNQKSWKTKIDEQDRALMIRSEVYPICNDTNISNNFAESLFLVRSFEQETISEFDSSIEIIEVDDEVSFGEVANVEVDIKKGDTAKYSISFWIADGSKKISEVTKLHLYGKFSTFSGKIPIALDSNCDEKLENDDYEVVVQGLGLEVEEDIEVSGLRSSFCQTGKEISSVSSPKDLVFEIVSFPEELLVGEEVSTFVLLQNNKEDSIDAKLWSYVYRGPKSYSGEREKNQISFSLDPGERNIAELKNLIESADPGDYKLKVLFNKDDQKTNSEITRNVSLSQGSSVSINEFQNPENKEGFTGATSVYLDGKTDILYESNTEKAKKTVVWFFIVALLCLVFVLILKK